MRTWTRDDERGARHTLTVSVTGVQTLEQGSGPTFGGAYGLAEIAAGAKREEWPRRFGAQAYAEALAEIERILAAWRPPEVVACDGCSDLVEVHRLFNSQILRCPRCATYHEASTDHEYGREPEYSLVRLTVDEAAGVLSSHNPREAAWLRSRCG